MRYLSASIACALIAALLCFSGCADDSSSASTASESSPEVTTKAAAAVEEKPAPAGPVVFDPPELNFGIVSEGQQVAGSATLRNLTDGPMRILGSATSCGCTKAPDLRGVVIPPGGEHPIDVSIKIKTGLGEKHEQVKVVVEGMDRPLFLDLRAEAALAVRANPPHLDAAREVEINGQKQFEDIWRGEVTVSSRDGKPFRILAAAGKPPVFANFDPSKDSPRNEYTLNWDLSGYTAETMPWFWVLETDHPDAPVVDLRVRHRWTLPSRTPRSWVLKDQRVLIGQVKPKVPVAAEVQIEYAANAEPQPQTASVQSSSAQMNIELVRAEPEDQFLNFHLRVTPRQQKSGLFYEEFTLWASGHSIPVRIIGRVAE